MSANISPEMEKAGAEALVELQHSLIKAAADVLKRHGNDPNSIVILACGFSQAIRSINREIDPKFLPFIKRLLELPK